MPYVKTYQSFSEDGKIEQNTSKKRPLESPKVPIFKDIDMDEDLKTPNYNVDRPPKQKSTPKKTEFPKPRQIIKCKLANDTDSEWRKLNVISRGGKATGKNKCL